MSSLKLTLLLALLGFTLITSVAPDSSSSEESDEEEAEEGDEEESEGGEEESEGEENEENESENEMTVRDYYNICRNSTCFTSVVCDGHTQMINCSRNATIEVLLATYGRLGKTFCWNASLEATNQNINCTNYVTSLFTESCEDKSICQIMSANITLTNDRCNGTNKYLWVGYKCV
ncbi:latrophilin-like protein 1 [Dunckerocampus dactyliophorus]|uniref:latrophilin-like protein 1 n=1 Tax=Dunckerocampus dactyliophorus TaxID=161453 RepID=UPI0024061F59|nr:latrophilin-like protein 1 [Dunckerocampus dactyliophorus]